MEKGGTAAVTGRHPKRTQHTRQAQRKSIAPVTMMTVMTMNVTYALPMGISPKHRHHRHHRQS